jgi:hypothetical protein
MDKEALIEAFVDRWGSTDRAISEEFRRELKDLLFDLDDKLDAEFQAAGFDDHPRRAIDKDAI